MQETFPIAPFTGTRWLSPGALIPIAVLAIVLVVLFVFPRFAARHVRFDVTTSGLAIKGDLYGRTIPWNEIDLSGARVLNLNEDREFRLKWRTNGTGTPGYSAGWFKLADGDKALAFVTDPTRVAYIPTSSGYAVMMSVANPAAFLESLRQHAAG